MVINTVLRYVQRTAEHRKKEEVTWRIGRVCRDNANTRGLALVRVMMLVVRDAWGES
jgi:hypothetical protein